MNDEESKAQTISADFSKDDRTFWIGQKSIASYISSPAAYILVKAKPINGVVTLYLNLHTACSKSLVYF